MPDKRQSCCTWKIALQIALEGNTAVLKIGNEKKWPAGAVIIGCLRAHRNGATASFSHNAVGRQSRCRRRAATDLILRISSNASRT